MWTFLDLQYFFTANNWNTELHATDGFYYTQDRDVNHSWCTKRVDWISCPLHSVSCWRCVPLVLRCVTMTICCFQAQPMPKTFTYTLARQSILRYTWCGYCVRGCVCKSLYNETRLYPKCVICVQSGLWVGKWHHAI